jgi:hypothetical protein
MQPELVEIVRLLKILVAETTIIMGMLIALWFMLAITKR